MRGGYKEFNGNAWTTLLTKIDINKTNDNNVKNMINFTEILSDFYIKNLGIPIFSVFMTTAVKVVSRKDHSLKVTRNDLAVGINLIVTGLIMLLNYAVKLADNAKTLSTDLLADNTAKLLNMVVLVLFYCIAAFLISVVIRIYGWQKDNEKELSTYVGVIFPLIVGGLLLVMAANSSNQ